MSKTGAFLSFIQEFLRLIAVLLALTVATTFLAWVFSGFEWNFTSYPYTQGRLY